MKKIITLFLFFAVHLVFFTSNAQTDCNPATLTKVVQENTGNRLTWTMPVGNDEVTLSQSENFFDSSGVPEDIGIYQRFTSEDLITVNGGLLTQVIFVPAYVKEFQTVPGHTYTIQIYRGGVWSVVEGRNPGTLISSQELNNNDLIFHEENAITLKTRVAIDATQELWIGYFCTNIEEIQDKYKGPAGVDAGPRKEGLGNLLFYQNQWRTLYEVAGSSWDNNWCIRGIVQTTDGESVNIVFNDTKIADNISGTTYFHDNPTGEEYCYEVVVNCLVEGVSPLSNRICIPGVGVKDNEKKSKYVVYPNPTAGALSVKSYVLRVIDFEIYDVYGRMQKAGYSMQKAEGEVVLNVSNLATGVYFIRLMDEEGVSVQHFIKE